ncbi:MAG TPA: class I SAM-dependent methyltransferase [Ignavibacteriales bacterium]|nr:class I SAM-dependent methyltransferase [Ignavibacteriales bacterium]HOL81332.1 class I SAM-dependent methyltransferase [Ignavibacteriales bacterium]HOM65448.1 class I SAM-dependent methyltransferase [Ignavibacteriales bacterium]HPD68294.1 class I SAM-dependent methyltransferase [Ignavibacteriales bacterium]HPP33899.1 class I SAM-dependent methyltransferase [Ignavibacteriales bacterium]
MQVNNYTHISEIYTDLMSHINYSKWAKYIYEITKDYVSDNPFVLDVTAGNGLLTRYMKEYYNNILMNDLSYEMLNNSDLEVYKVCSDIRFLPFKAKFDLVISNYDSINYLLTENDVEKAFTEVANILAPNGIFTFDVTLESNCLQFITPIYYNSKYKRYHYYYKTQYDKIRRIHTTTIDVYNDIGQKFSEVHEQKIYDLETIFYLLDKANLEVLRCYECFTTNIATEESKRAQFITKLYRD